MTCPALEEQVDDGFIALARGPADHLAVVQVSHPVNVSAGIEENADALELSMRRSEMEWGRVVAAVADVRVRSMFDQQAHRVGMAHGRMQPSGASCEALASKTRVSLQQRAQR